MSAPISEIDLQAFSEFEKKGWDQAATGYFRLWSGMSRQAAGPLLDSALVANGSRVLDVATGPGFIAATAADRGAHAIGLDFAGAQVELARSNFPGVEFRQGDAEQLPFEAETFDAVVAGFGINHLPHPARAFAEAYRVLRRGGSFAFTVWAAPVPDSAFGIVLGAISSHGEPIAGLPPGPPYFRFADPGETQRELEAAGFVDAGSKVVPLFWHHDTTEQLFEAFSEGAVRASAMLKSQSAETLDKLRPIIRAQVERFRQDGQYVVPMPAALSWARKP